MSTVEHYALGLRSGIKQGGVELRDRLDRGRLTAGGESHPVPGGMIETAENLRRQYGISRDEQDELAGVSDAELRRQARTGRPLSLVLVDADHFKRINDTHGHPAGDQVLAMLGRLLSLGVRTPVDMAARLGGDRGGNRLCRPGPSGPRVRRIRRGTADGVGTPVGDDRQPAGAFRRSAGRPVTNLQAGDTQPYAYWRHPATNKGNAQS